MERESGGLMVASSLLCMQQLIRRTLTSAAPGNKTTYISALMHNQGQVHAFERSHARFKTLEKMLERAGCVNVKAQRADFMESKPKDHENVTRM